MTHVSCCAVYTTQRAATQHPHPARRYRLMVRRCMEGNRRFGMAQAGRSGPDGLDELAVEAEILECNPLPDGCVRAACARAAGVCSSAASGAAPAWRRLSRPCLRACVRAGRAHSTLCLRHSWLAHASHAPHAHWCHRRYGAPPVRRYYLELVGRRRLRITGCRELDGYRVASADVLADAPEPPQAAGAGGAAAAGGAAVEADTPAAAAAPRGAAAAAAPPPPETAQQLAARVLVSSDALLQRMRGVLASRRVGAGHIQEFMERCACMCAWAWVWMTPRTPRMALAPAAAALTRQPCRGLAQPLASCAQRCRRPRDTPQHAPPPHHGHTMQAG
jgi:Lon protease-like protein